MATRTQSGAIGYIISLVLFVMLFLFTFALAVYFRTQITEAQVQAQEATKVVAELIKPKERNRPEVLEMKAKHANTGMSVVGQMLAENIRLKQLINNTPKSSVDAIKNETAAAGVETGRTLLGEVRRLHAEHAADQELIGQYKTDINAFSKRLQAIEEQKGIEAQEYEKTITLLKSTLTSLQEDTNTFRTQVDGQRQALQEQLESVRAKTDQSVHELRSTIEQKDLQIHAQKKRLDELTGELASTGKGGSGHDLTREHDGVITSILSEEGLVYIDRGRLDQIFLGMTFEVFNKNSGVIVDETGELRGKATIEIIRMSDRSSLCRVVRAQRGIILDEDDLIANIIYDPNISYRFHVFGEFDIDNTGQVTVTDRRRVETMVTQWGGQLIPKLSYNTDFLVLGKEPELPAPLPRGVVDPIEIERRAAQKRKYIDYQSLINEAKSLSIPILNQNRFLVLVGYYHR